MENLIKSSNNHYYQIINGKKKRISKKKYLEMKKYQIGGNNLTKREFIEYVYRHLIKYKVISIEKGLRNPQELFNINFNIPNYQSIRPFLFYSHLFTDPDIQPIYIRKDVTQYLLKKQKINSSGEYNSQLFKNYFEIQINLNENDEPINKNGEPINYDEIHKRRNEKKKLIKYNKKTGDEIKYDYEIRDGAERFNDESLNNNNILNNLFLEQELHEEIYGKKSNIWSNISGLFTTQKKFIILPINVIYPGISGHQCVIIFDNINKKIYPFDPINIYDDSIIYKLASLIKRCVPMPDYLIVSPNVVCGSITMGELTPINTNYFKYECPDKDSDCAANHEKGYCVQITFYYINFIVNNYNTYSENLYNEYLQSLVLDDTSIKDLTSNEFANLIDRKKIDIDKNVNNIIIIFHHYQALKIREWLIDNRIHPAILSNGESYNIYKEYPNKFHIIQNPIPLPAHPSTQYPHPSQLPPAHPSTQYPHPSQLPPTYPSTQYPHPSQLPYPFPSYNYNSYPPTHPFNNNLPPLNNQDVEMED